MRTKISLVTLLVLLTSIPLALAQERRPQPPGGNGGDERNRRDDPRDDNGGGNNSGNEDQDGEEDDGEEEETGCYVVTMEQDDDDGEDGDNNDGTPGDDEGEGDDETSSDYFIDEENAVFDESDEKVGVALVDEDKTAKVRAKGMVFSLMSMKNGFKISVMYKKKKMSKTVTGEAVPFVIRDGEEDMQGAYVIDRHDRVLAASFDPKKKKFKFSRAGMAEQVSCDKMDENDDEQE